MLLAYTSEEYQCNEFDENVLKESEISECYKKLVELPKEIIKYYPLIIELTILILEEPMI